MFERNDLCLRCILFDIHPEFFPNKRKSLFVFVCAMVMMALVMDVTLQAVNIFLSLSQLVSQTLVFMEVPVWKVRQDISVRACLVMMAIGVRIYVS